jgi:molecular chaperone HscB
MRFLLEPRFDLAEEELHQRYVRLQQQLHPDRFVNRSAPEKTYALEHSAALNEAYDVLKNPYQRALLLLTLKGQDMSGETTATIADPALLEEILDLREQLAEAAEPEQMSTLQREIHSLYQHTLDTLTQAFSTQRYDEAKSLTRRLHYLQKMLEDIPMPALRGDPLS